MKTLTSFLLVFLCSGIASLQAGEPAQPDAIRKTLSQATAVELPLKAAEMVKQAGADRPATTENVVNAVLNLKAASAVATVEAISRMVPEMAAVAARAAAIGAPAKAGKIVEAVCRAVPKDYRNIAVATAQAVPGAGKEILEAVANAIPALKSPINLATLSYGGNTALVAEILDQAKSLPQTALTATVQPKPAAAAAAVVAQGPPYIPPSTTPASSPPSQSGVVPAGGRSQVDP